MSSTQPARLPGQGESPGDLGFPEHLAGLRARLAEVEAGRECHDVHLLGAVTDLETAYEELRVADEEVRAQQDQIAALLERHELVRWQQDRLLGALPVPAVVTDQAGTIRLVNAAAAALLSQRVARLLGKPLFVLFDPAHRRALRDLARDGVRGEEGRRTATLVGRDGSAVPVAVSVVVRDGQPADLTWLLLPPAARTGERGLDLVPGALVELAGLSTRGAGRRQVMQRAAGLCSQVLDGMAVSLSLGPPARPDAVASSAVLAQALDGAQVTAGEGPCHTAYATRAVVTTPALDADARWPRLGAVVGRLPDTPSASGLAVPIEVGERLVGALNAYGDVGAPESRLEEAAELLAATLGAVFHELELNAELERLEDDMQRALSSRTDIDQAKGIIMARRGCGPDEAFALLTEMSSRQERKLRDVARAVVDGVTARHP